MGKINETNLWLYIDFYISIISNYYIINIITIIITINFQSGPQLNKEQSEKEWEKASKKSTQVWITLSMIDFAEKDSR